ncbi:MAG TPA: cell division protein FtsZ, partial [Sphingomicrobium sp.]
NDLGGKIRVSVVATGIEADAVAQPSPGKVFAFPANRAPAPAPKAIVEEQPAGIEDEAPLDLDEEVDGDELLLGEEDVLTSPVGKPPIAPPADEDEAAAAGEQPAGAAGGTLFERMSNIARGAPKAQLDEEEDDLGYKQPIDIPRFLNRQNNQ